MLLSVRIHVAALGPPPHRPQRCSFCSWTASIAAPTSQGKVQLPKERQEARWNRTVGHVWPPSSCQLNHADLSRDCSSAVYSKPVPGSRIKQQLPSLLALSQAPTLPFKGSLRLKHLPSTLKKTEPTYHVHRFHLQAVNHPEVLLKEDPCLSPQPHSSHVTSLQRERRQQLCQTGAAGAAPPRVPKQQRAPGVNWTQAAASTDGHPAWTCGHHWDGVQRKPKSLEFSSQFCTNSLHARKALPQSFYICKTGTLVTF